MKILMLSLFSPLPPDAGSKIRAYHILRHLSRRHNVTLVTFVESMSEMEYAKELQELCEDVYMFLRPERGGERESRVTWRTILPGIVRKNESPPLRAKVQELLATRHFDGAIVENLPMTPYLVHAPIPMRVMDPHNLEYHSALQRWRSGRADVPGAKPGLLGRLACERMRWYETRMWRTYERVLVCSEEDAQAVLSLEPRARVEIMPNGVDASYFVPTSEYADPPTILYVGAMWYFPNEDAALWFGQEVMPLIWRSLPEARFVVVGSRPGERIRALTRDPRIEVTGFVPDLRPYYERANLVVIPLRFGAGGSSLKIFEAMASQRAVLSTTLGCRGIAAKDGQEVAIADDKEMFAARAVELLSGDELRHRLAVAGRRLVEMKYDWPILTQRLDRIFR